jgi:hypothetical protein
MPWSTAVRRAPDRPARRHGSTTSSSRVSPRRPRGALRGRSLGHRHAGLVRRPCALGTAPAREEREPLDGDPLVLNGDISPTSIWAPSRRRTAQRRRWHGRADQWRPERLRSCACAHGLGRGSSRSPRPELRPGSPSASTRHVLLTADAPAHRRRPRAPSSARSSVLADEAPPRPPERRLLRDIGTPAPYLAANHDAARGACTATPTGDVCRPHVIDLGERRLTVGPGAGASAPARACAERHRGRGAGGGR